MKQDRYVMLVIFKILPPVRPFVKSEGWPVIGLCPHVDSTGVFGINLNTLYSIFWSLKEVFSATNKAIRLYGLYRTHLAIGV